MFASYRFTVSVSVRFLIRSELIAIQHSHCVGAVREEEKLLERESPSEERSSPRILFGRKDAALPSEKVCVSLRKAQCSPANFPSTVILWQHVVSLRNVGPASGLLKLRT